MTNKVLLALSFGLMLAGAALFFYGAYVTNQELSKAYYTEVPCYDKYGNEIVGINCKELMLSNNSGVIMFIGSIIIGLGMYFSRGSMS